MEPRVGYLYVTVSEQISLSGAQATFREMLDGAMRYGQSRILLDCTRVKGEWTAEDRFAFGVFVADEHKRAADQFAQSLQLAVYAIAPLMDPGRYTQTVANNRGARMRASDSLQ